VNTVGEPSYRRGDVSIIGASLLYRHADGTVHDFEGRPDLVRLLARWDRFEPLDEVLVRACGGIDVLNLAAGARGAGARSRQSWLDRLTHPVRRFVHRQQLACLAQQPAFMSLRRFLLRAIEDGLLVSADAVLHEAARTAAPGPPLPIASIGIVSRNRPARLRRCVASFLENARTFARRVTIVVLDDSDRRSAIENRAALAALRSEYDAPILYSGIDERRAFAATLVRHGLPKGAVDDALGERSIASSALNALLLETQGQAVMIAGDDADAELVAHPEGHQGLAVTQDAPSQRPVPLWYRPGDRRALPDVCSIHESVLGRRPCDLIELFRGSAAVHFGRACDRLLRGCVSPTARVLASCAGTADGAGGRRSRIGHRGTVLHGVGVPRCYTLSHRPEFLGGLLAVDNRGLRPPFVSDGSDALATFRALLTRSDDDAFVCDVPWALKRDTSSSDAAFGHPASARPHLSIGSILATCLTAADPVGATPSAEPRLRRAGSVLRGLASLDIADLERHLCGALAQAAFKDVRPDLREARIEVFRRGESLIPDCLAAGSSIADAKVRMKSILDRAGDLLECWPDLVSTSQDLRGAGHALVSAV
jgi:hypothetical protein